MGIGDRLKQERERLGSNQTDFAAQAGVSKNTQYNYEKGDRSPDAAYLAAIADVGVDILYVVTGQHVPLPADSISAADSRILEQYHSLSEKDQEAVAHLISALAATSMGPTA
ncbi:helix-turn-helix transcriptional regulator [Pseudomonas sp. BN415]|uniref:helix-turn-helix domain-containing protein n=1 Tax=Pseudomonas sp. BN415 TaxID=2567889 RepID=UPI002453CDDB|nr:helix-turn-helix transcriptional regulator [Pseudomonas sp. BN415]MDH4585620.1 helix-turn-helix transcriptional regulator [Pseudomonas sp. BN415]